jgi:phage-related minor tail protein
VATNALYDAFYKQPIPGVAQNKVYYRLKQDIRTLRTDTKHLSDALAHGAGRDETLPIWQDLMQAVQRAIDHAASVFTTRDVDQKARAAAAILDQLAPYYDPDAAGTEPAVR